MKDVRRRRALAAATRCETQILSNDSSVVHKAGSDFFVKPVDEKVKELHFVDFGIWS